MVGGFRHSQYTYTPCPILASHCEKISLTYLVNGHVSPHAARSGEHHTALATLEHALALVAVKDLAFDILFLL